MKKLILLLLVLLLTGCYDYKELEKLELVSTGFVDYRDDKFYVAIEVLDTNQNTGKASYFLEGEGTYFSEAVNNIFKESTYTPYYDHMNAIVISETVAKDKLKEMYDNLTRDPGLRKDFYVLLCKNIESYKNFKIGQKESIGDKIKNTIKYNLKNNARYNALAFRDILDNHLNYKNYTLGEIEFTENNIKLTNTHLVLNDSLDITIDDDVALIQNLLNNANSTFRLYNENTYEIYEYNLKKKIEKNKIIINIDCNVRLINIIEDGAFSYKEIDKLEKDVNYLLKKMFEEKIRYSKEIDKDIFNFNYDYYLQYPKNAKETAWRELKYEIRVNSKVNEKGLIINSLGGLSEE